MSIRRWLFGVPAYDDACIDHLIMRTAVRDGYERERILRQLLAHPNAQQDEQVWQVLLMRQNDYVAPIRALATDTLIAWLGDVGGSVGLTSLLMMMDKFTILAEQSRSDAQAVYAALDGVLSEPTHAMSIVDFIKKSQGKPVRALMHYLSHRRLMDDDTLAELSLLSPDGIIARQALPWVLGQPKHQIFDLLSWSQRRIKSRQLYVVVLLAVMRKYPDDGLSLALTFTPHATGAQLRTLMWALNRAGVDTPSFSRAVVAHFGISELVNCFEKAKDALWLISVRHQLGDVLADISPDVQGRLDTLQVILLPFDADSERLMSAGVVRPTPEQLRYFFATHVVSDVAQYERFARVFDLTDALRARYALKLPTWELLLYVVATLQAGGVVDDAMIQALALRFDGGHLYPSALSSAQRATLKDVFTDKSIRQRLSVLIWHLQALKLID